MDCNTNHIELKKQLAATLRVSGALTGLPIVEVSGHTDAALNCDNNHLSFYDLLALCFGVDGCDKPALRVKYIDSCDPLTTCENSSDAHPFNKIFAYDSTLKTYALVLNVTE